MQPTAVPEHSLLQSELATAYFHDSFEAPLENSNQTALELYLRAVKNTPGWINFLMSVRNRVAAFFGLKDLGHLSDLEDGKAASEYKVGDRIGIFSILFISDQELVVGDADKHLSAKISIYKHPGEQQKVVATTMVHVNNFLGRAYLFFVVPVHKLIVPSMVARIAGHRGNS